MRNPSIVLTAIGLTIGAAKDTIGGPKATLIIERGVETGFTPKPTARALLGARSDNLFERQAALETCGYYSGWLSPKRNQEFGLTPSRICANLRCGICLCDELRRLCSWVLQSIRNYCLHALLNLRQLQRFLRCGMPKQSVHWQMVTAFKTRYGLCTDVM